MNLKIDQSDLNKLKNKLDKMRAFESKTLSNELGKTGLEIVRLAKRSAPVDNGALKQSISAQRSGKSINVVAAAHYAPYVEFGTGGRVDLTDITQLGIPQVMRRNSKAKGFEILICRRVRSFLVRRE